MLERYLRADPTIMEKLVLESSLHKANAGQAMEVQARKDYMERWELEWGDLNSRILV